jgi:hypothetical protein
MTFIVVSKKRGNFKVVIDDEDWTTVKNYKWSIHYKNGKVESVQTTVRKRGVKTTLILHRLIMNVCTQIDHIDGNALNNKKENLRVCSTAENCRNRDKHKSNSSGYKGVTYFRQKNKTTENVYIVARICVNYKKIHLGIFSTEKEAAIAYNAAALKYHGEFARLNKI